MEILESQAARKLEYHEYDSRLSAYVVLTRMNPDGQEEMLLALWNGAKVKQWTVPGGGVDLYETPAEGAVREAKEESGYDVELTSLLAVDTLVISPSERAIGIDRPLLSIRVLYHGRIIGGELTAELDGSTDESRWINLSDIPGLDRVGLVDVAVRALMDTRKLLE